jgi:hypothetical protein
MLASTYFVIFAESRGAPPDFEAVTGYLLSDIADNRYPPQREGA